MLPDYYEFYNPVRIICGRRALEQLPAELAALKVARPLVVTDRGVVSAGLFSKVIDVFDGTGASAGGVYGETPPDSSLETVTKVATLYKTLNCDSFLAIGGGSVVDTAKAANILVTEGVDDLLPFSGVEILAKPLKPLVVVPTTAGTGSEVTGAAVISNLETGRKMAFISRRLLPTLALLDPRMTATLPPATTAATGMDALSHAVESCISIQKNPLSDAHAAASLKLISGNLLRAVENGKDPDARLAMMNAAMLAGAAFSNSMVGVVHSLGHAAGGVAHLPHGMAMGIFLPVGLDFNLKVRAEEIGELLLPLAGPEVYAGTPENDRPRAVLAHIVELKDKLHTLCGLPRTLSEAGVKEADIPLIAETAMLDGALTMNPREVTLEDALALVKRAF